MRIGVNCFLLQKNIGGLRQYFHTLFRELLRTDRENGYVFFYFKHNLEELEHLGNERWREGAVLLTDQREVLRHVGQMDLYFCPFGSLWPRPVPLPSVVTLVDIQEKYYPQFFSKLDLWNRAYHFDASTRAADQVITISDHSKRSIAHHHHIPKQKIHVAYLAADHCFHDGLEEKASLPLPERFIFYPANRWLHKNHDNLLKALLLLKHKYALTVNCVLTGFDYESGYPLKEKLNEYGLNGQVRILGYTSNLEIKHIYQRAAMLCFPSLFEGFGLPLVEAMAVGCPVVCSRETSIPEVVGEAALLFDPFDPSDIADKILCLWTNPELQKVLVKKGKEQAKKFSATDLAARHGEVFRLAVQSYRTRRYLFYRYFYEPLHTIRMYITRRQLQNSDVASF